MGTVAPGSLHWRHQTRGQRRVWRTAAMAAGGVVIVGLAAWLPFLHQHPFALFYAYVLLATSYGDGTEGALAVALAGAGSALLIVRFGAPAFEALIFAVIMLLQATLVSNLRRARRNAMRAGERVRRQLAVTEAITASMGEGVFAVDREGCITFVNAAAERMLGWTGWDLRGRDIRDTIHVQDVTGSAATVSLYPLLESLHPGVDTASGEEVLTRKDGTTFPVDYVSSPITADGWIIGAVITCQDISERKRVEGERAQRYAAAQTERDRLQQVLEVMQDVENMRDEFLSSISHDLKNPLTTIRGLTQLVQRQLARQNPGDEMRLARNVENIMAATVKMAALVDDVLDLTRLQMGRALDLDLAPTDVVALVGQAVAQQPVRPSHRIEVEAGAATVVGLLDGARLERVVLNLLSNAVKYSPHGGRIVVGVAREHGASDDWIVLTVRDSGVGIPAADLPHIFERFHRGANVAGRIQGTGIGLASAEQIVAQHGGTIGVTSQEGQGATFTIRLPLHPPPPTPLRPAQLTVVEGASGPPPPGQSKTVSR